MALDLILVRHAVAFERDRTRWPNDRLRPLTPAGKRKFRRVAAGLAEWLPRVECLLASPLVRARETAELLTRVAGWPEAVTCEELAPGIAAGRMFTRLRKHSERAIGLVGHEPGLSVLLSVAIAGNGAHLPIPLKKGGVACVRFAERVEPGHAVLQWLAPPRMLRGLR